MDSKILMNRKEFLEHLRYMSANGPANKFYAKRIKKVASEGLKHFAYDYTNCAASYEMNSKVVDILASLHHIVDTAWVRRGKSTVQITCHVIFDNGESLSNAEAIGGLGDVAPVFLKQRIEWLRNEKIKALRDSKYSKGCANSLKDQSGSVA